MSRRAVIFDLGGVVLDSPLHAIARYEADLGIPGGFVNRVVLETGPQGAWSRLERGEIGMADFHAAFEAECSRAGHELSGLELMARIAACGPRQSMLEAIRRLRAAGLRVGALTNNWQAEGESTAPLRELFDRFIESSVVGLRKPDPRIYHLACERLGVMPSEAVFLDDIGRNLKAARALGIETIKVDEPEPAIDALGELLGLDLR
jgi:epoxide hydrolase-like predicted phosphatase